MFWVCIATDHVKPIVGITTGKTEGFDFGLKTYLTASNPDNDYLSPLFFLKASKEIAKLDKQFSRKLKGSKNKNKARIKRAKKHNKIANQRNDFQWKLAHDLCSKFDVIKLETLNLKGMKKLWGKKISDLSHYSFLEKLKLIAAKTGKQIILIDQWFPSSKTCNTCGHVYKELKLKDRGWICPNCFTKHDRDRNAAINIKKWVGAST